MARNKTQLSICIVGAMLVADFVLFGYWPSRQRLEVLQQAQGRQRSLVSLAEAHRRQLPALRDRLAQCERTLEPYRDRVPGQREFGSFLQDVSTLMNQHHLQEQVVDPCDERPIEGLVAVPVVVRCKGQLTDLFSFYRQLGSIKRLVRLEKVRFTNDPDLSGRVQMDAQMLIFYRPGVSSEGRLASADLALL